MTKAVFTHTSMRTTVIIAVLGLEAQGKLYTLKTFNSFSTMPAELFNISCQTIVAVTGATIRGKISTTRMILEKRLFRLLSSMATPMPRAISTAVEATP